MESYTEVDLLRQNTIVTVRRTINSDDKGSKWTIDGRKANEKDVKEIMVELAINVDNLCSFMPQDKVRTTHSYFSAIIFHVVRNSNNRKTKCQFSNLNFVIKLTESKIIKIM